MWNRVVVFVQRPAVQVVFYALILLAAVAVFIPPVRERIMGISAAAERAAAKIFSEDSDRVFASEAAERKLVNKIDERIALKRPESVKEVASAPALPPPAPLSPETVAPSPKTENLWSTGTRVRSEQLPCGTLVKNFVVTARSGRRGICYAGDVLEAIDRAPDSTQLLVRCVHARGEWESRKQELPEGKDEDSTVWVEEKMFLYLIGEGPKPPPSSSVRFSGPPCGGK